MDPSKHRRIRSFVKREGRMTPAQKHALETLLPVYGIDPVDTPLNLDALFPRHAPRYLEIGFGMGASLITMAQSHPDNDYIGVEVHRPGVGSTLIRAAELQLSNLKIINHDAVTVLKQAIPDNSLDGIYLFFPDPWPKKRHHKRRIVQAEFVTLVHHGLKAGGVFHMATDWEDYALAMREVMQQAKGFSACPENDNHELRRQRPETKYERRGKRLGHHVWDLLFVKSNE